MRSWWNVCGVLDGAFSQHSRRRAQTRSEARPLGFPSTTAASKGWLGPPWNLNQQQIRRSWIAQTLALCLELRDHTPGLCFLFRKLNPLWLHVIRLLLFYPFFKKTPTRDIPGRVTRTARSRTTLTDIRDKTNTLKPQVCNIKNMKAKCICLAYIIWMFAWVC